MRLACWAAFVLMACGRSHAEGAASPQSTPTQVPPAQPAPSAAATSPTLPVESIALKVGDYRLFSSQELGFLGLDGEAAIVRNDGVGNMLLWAVRPGISKLVLERDDGARLERQFVVSAGTEPTPTRTERVMSGDRLSLPSTTGVVMTAFPRDEESVMVANEPNGDIILLGRRLGSSTMVLYRGAESELVRVEVVPSPKRVKVQLVCTTPCRVLVDGKPVSPGLVELRAGMRHFEITRDGTTSTFDEVVWGIPPYSPRQGPQYFQF